MLPSAQKETAKLGNIFILAWFALKETSNSERAEQTGDQIEGKPNCVHIFIEVLGCFFLFVFALLAV
jgi:hypothetical protein